MKYITVVFVIVCCCLVTDLSTAQTAAADNKLSRSITFHPIPTGPSVFGIFQGRVPCREIVRHLKIVPEDDCAKLKLSLTLYRDSVTFQPTVYSLNIVGAGDVVQLEGSSYRQKVLQGKWTITRDMRSNPAAEVYQLKLGQAGVYFYLLKGDEYILFVLDENKGFRVGNEDFSYTLNRVQLVPASK